jgi:hypothetical protein
LRPPPAPPALELLLASDFAIKLKSLGTMRVIGSPPASLYFDLATFPPLFWVSKKNWMSSGANNWILIYVSLSLKRFGVRPSRPDMPFENESITPSMSVIMNSKSEMIGLIIPTYYIPSIRLGICLTRIFIWKQCPLR